MNLINLYTGLLVAFTSQIFVHAWGTDTEQITFITPIYEGALASDNRDNDIAILEGMKSMLGVGGTYVKLGFSFSSWSLSRDITDADQDYAFNSTNLDYVLGLAESLNLPVLIHANNGRWADCCTSNSDGGWNDALLDHIAAQGNTTMQDSSGKSLFQHDGGGNYFSLSRYNTFYRDYKKRNVQASMTRLANWAKQHKDLFVGVSLDSETIFPSDSADHNPLAIQEWRDWLQNTGLYGPSGDFFGHGRVPAFTSITDFNSATGQTFSSWSAVTPPSSITAGNPFSEEWQRFRITLIRHSVSDETLWIAEAGIPRNLIYGHQTPGLQFYAFADDLPTSTAANGASGYTAYGRAPLDFGSVDNPLRADGTNNFGLFELNPLSSDPQFAYDTILTLFNDGAKVICPNAFENVTNKDQYSLFDSPTTGDTWGNALVKFLKDHGNTPRYTQPPGWNPGDRVYDLYDNFDSATKSGPDNRVNVSGSSGNVALKTVYSAVGGTISWSFTLPSVSNGRRLNLWTKVGIDDGAGAGGGTATWLASMNGTPLFGNGVVLAPTYWVWKHWLPVMVDVTEWAGKQVTLSLSTTGNDYYGWTQWASPAIYRTSASNNNLALNKAVSGSSSDGTGSGWDLSYLTDGNVQGGTDGRNGWSSVSHDSASASEWVQVDLGGSYTVGKVVLHPRSDLSNSAGTGFPVNFQLKGSLDGATWTTLSTQVGYHGVQAGRGEVLTFPSHAVRYLRVASSQLSGVAGESGYRMQFTELEVYS
ncbi:f5/8 type C domain-containing protein [Pochonia chlamydosporia 170]|uniref:F5/8 type C domain-containing protein n=1 Tax=Pochonia chlamydosporia 170 TaxID=1380566 RepID=A0A179G2Q9_METCM|nr:f5/8 type C domain-containing protein [Pochonia chlamydosporia 170]OAQ72037.1 f5/8 type C domain-containing protein [Pochonia chlamydosporia 170]